MRLALFAACAALSACTPKVITRDVPVTVKVPVSAPCVTGWPQKPPPLPDASHWAQMDVRMKAAALGKYAIEMTNYDEALRAATAACPEIRQ
jgi:hypothetical protein